MSQLQRANKRITELEATLRVYGNILAEMIERNAGEIYILPDTLERSYGSIVVESADDGDLRVRLANELEHQKIMGRAN